MTYIHHVELSTPWCADALTDEDIKIGASDFEDSDSKSEKSDLEESKPEESENMT